MNDTSDAAVAQVLSQIAFNADGLAPAVAQQFDTGEVLMLAWMNREAIAATLRTREVHYWSRSRRSLWRKGETSGHAQRLKDFRWDCDADSILVQVDQVGPACHTGRRNCFFNAWRDGKASIIAAPETAANEATS